MRFIGRTKKYILFGIIILFCYRVAQLQQKQEAFLYHENEEMLQDHMENVLMENLLAHQLTETTNDSPKNIDIASNKFNAHITHYEYLISELITKNMCDEAKLKQIEAALIQLEKETKEKGIYSLLDKNLIEKIRNQISYLRMQKRFMV